MKKTGIAVFLIIIFGLMFSCTSSKADGSKNESGYEISAAKDEKKNYTGWVDTSKKEIELSLGIVKVKVKPNLGSFNIGVINKNDKFVPVLQTSNEYTSTNLQLKTMKKIYKLVSAPNILYSVLKTDNSICVVYEIPNVAEVKALFNFMQSSSDSDIDTLKIVYTITNKSAKKNEFALKAIYDTFLGETTQSHFYVSGNIPVKNEVMYRTMQNQKWVISKNNSAAVQFLFDGTDVSPIEIVALANNSTFSKNTWEPDMISYRAFDTVLSYNNSCIGVIWPSEKLMPKESAKIIHYISFAVDGNEPNGEKFVYGISKNDSIDITQKIPKIDDGKENNSNEKNVTKIGNNELFNENKQIPNVEFNVNGISKEKFTPQYIQNLLDRIDELEKNSAAANREEILQLNAELDLILSVLKQ